MTRVERDGERVELSDEERDRYKIVIDQGNKVFEQVWNGIYDLNSRNVTLLGIILSSISINLVLLSFLWQMGWQPSWVDVTLLKIIVICSGIALVVICISLLFPRQRLTLSVFEGDTLNKLLAASEEELFSHFLYNLQKGYICNKMWYFKRLQWFGVALGLFIIAILTFVILLLKTFVGG